MYYVLGNPAKEGQFATVEITDGLTVPRPVIHLSRDGGPELNQTMLELAENVVDVLNGANPRHKPHGSTSNPGKSRDTRLTLNVWTGDRFTKKSSLFMEMDKTLPYRERVETYRKLADEGGLEKLRRSLTNYPATVERGPGPRFEP